MSLVKEFKEFIMRGNVVDMAIGVIVGSAFSAIVTSLVDDIFMPLVGIVTGGIDISSLSATVGSATIAYGAFLNAIVNFLIVALILFAVVKSINKFKDLTKKKEEPAEEPKPARVCPFCKMEIADDATRCPHCTSVLE